MRPRALLHALLPLAAALAGCGKMAIEGELVDVTGAPLAGAVVTAIGTPCQTTTDEAGHFDLTCPPGTYEITMGQTGYISHEVSVEATERKRYDLEKTVLIKIPEGEGLFLLTDGVYSSMKPGFLTRRESRGGDVRTYCVDPSRGEANALPARIQSLFDKGHEGWRPFKLNGDGCAYQMSKQASGRWEVDFAEKPAYEERAVGKGMNIALIELLPGDYFIADWKGFFVEVPGEKQAYTGFWLHVE